MNLDPLSFALSEISYTVANLTKKNFKSSVAAINHLVNQHGAEADRHLFRCLFSHIDFSGDGKSSGKDCYQVQYLSQEFGALLTKPSFVSILCCSIDNPLQQQNSLKPSQNLFHQISRVLRLTRVQEVAVALSLLSSSKQDIVNFALQFAKLKLPDLIRSYVDVDTNRQEGGLQILHLLLSQLTSNREKFGISQEVLDSFLKTIRKEHPRDKVAPIVSQYLYPNLEDITGKKLRDVKIMKKNMTEVGIAELMVENGYNCTHSMEDMRTVLSQCGAREITPLAVARVLGVMARTPVNLSGDHMQQHSDRQEIAGVSTWNVDVFLQAVKDMKSKGSRSGSAPQNSHLDWKEVIANLDHKGFAVLGRKGLRLLAQGIFRGLSEPFPIDCLYKPWTNTEGQVSLLTHALKNPDIMCLADLKGDTPTVSTDILKSAPNEDNREIATWKSLSLVETLLRLSDAGHYQQALELFKAPMNKCPDILVLALLQVSQPVWNSLKQELISNLMPIFLNQHSNAAVILHYAWHHQGHASNIRTLIMHSMAEWYMRGEPHDQVRLSRILDVAQDLKALSMLLNATPYAFVIDLACLASRREYLKLEKWLTDKIQEHKEPFIQACVTFLKRRCPQLLGIPMKEEPPQTRSQQLPPDIVATMLNCLKIWAVHLNPELAEAITSMCGNANVILNKSRPQPPGAMPGVGGPKQGPFPPQNMVNNMDPGAMPNMMNQPGAVGPPGQGLPQAMANLSLAPPGPPGSPSKTFPTMANPPPPPPPQQQQQPLPQQQQQPQMPQQQQQQPGAMGFNPMMPNQMPTGLGMQAPTPQPIMSGPRPGNPVPPLPPASNAVQPAVSKPMMPINPERLGNRSSGNPASDMSNIFPEMSQTFTKDVEDRANSYFQQIYNQPPNPTMSIDEVLAMLKSFKDSNDKNNRDVFACMLRNLFEEYRFFPQYPERELQITAQLFGGIIEQNIVTYWTLGIALRYILEALRKQPNTNMYLFGVASLERFKTKLKEYPQYCQHLAQIPHFMQMPPHLMEFVECGARSQEPPNLQMPHNMLNELSGRPMTPVSGFPGQMRPPLPMLEAGGGANAPPPPLPVVVPAQQPNVSNPSTTGAGAAAAVAPPAPSRVGTFAKPSIATATNIDTLLAGQGNDDVLVPPEAVQDKVFFIFNNLSLANMGQKAEELKDTVGTEYISWVSQYLVMKRASIEPNFHTLYSNFVDNLGIEALLTKVVNETFRNIKVLLRSDKGAANFSDRTLLKNLGHWLGMLTLAKCKPILTRDLNLKSLIYEAYQKGNQELLYVVPFSAKVLESCAKSSIFCKPNPWTLAIMNVLAELHQENDLKLNLKFEIEVLCKTLMLDIKRELKPTKYLCDPSRMSTLDHQLSPVKLPMVEDLTLVSTAPSNPPAGIPIPQIPGMPPPMPHNLVPPPPPPPLPTAGNMAVPPPPSSTKQPVLAPVVTATGAAAAVAVGIGAATSAPSSTSSALALPVQPRFGIHDINTNSLNNFLQQNIIINEQIIYIQSNATLRNAVVGAIEQTLQDFIVPISDRVIKVAVTTCEQIIKKDFALDSDEIRMRNASQAMSRNVCAGLALINSREPMLQQLKQNIQGGLVMQTRGANEVSLLSDQQQTPAQLKSIEDTANLLSNDNVEICANYIQKVAMERVGAEMDKKLTGEFEARKKARLEGRRHCDPSVLSYQIDRMPEQIRLMVGSVTMSQMAVYDEFARNVPGLQPLTELVLPSNSHAPGSKVSGQEELTLMYDKMLQEMESHIHMMTNPNIFMAQLQQLMQYVNRARSSQDKTSTSQLFSKVIEGLFEQHAMTGITDSETLLRFRECHMLVLKAFANHQEFSLNWVCKEVTNFLMQCREENRYNLDVVELFIRSGFVILPQYDLYLASLMENGLNQAGVSFATQLIQRLCVEDKGQNNQQQFSETDFLNCIEALNMINSRSRQSQPDSLPALIESLRSSGNSNNLMDRVPGNVTTMMQTGITQAREFDDPSGLHEKSEYLLKEWVTMYHSPSAGRDSFKAFNTFVTMMHTQGILKTDDLIARFFRLCTEMCVDLCYRALGEPGQSTTMIRARCFHTLDAFVRLIALLVKHSGDSNNTVTKINLLNKVLGILAGVLLQDHEVRYAEFQQLPYHRIFIMLFIELNAPEPILETINFQVLTAFCHVFHILRPSKAPGFAYAWLELISHRVFIGRLLALTPHQKGWGFYAQLLVDLFKVLAPFLRNACMTKPMHLLYKGTLRVLLVLLHDFPEFLCDYHYAFCDVIPPNAIQMRNLILSAFPRNVRPPDPFTNNLVMEAVPDINKAPRILTNVVLLIQPASFKKDLDSYLKTRAPITFLSELQSNLQANASPGTNYDIMLINALVLYVGTQAIPLLQNRGISMSTIAPSSHMDIFQNLAVNLDTEGRYLFLTAIANQLRYPNSHTHYFSCTLLYLFRQANDEAIQEQITRVLLERLVVNRPYPWGLLLTFGELVKNPTFKFWDHDFVHCAPEMEKLFGNVSRHRYQSQQKKTPGGLREEGTVDQ